MGGLPHLFTLSGRSPDNEFWPRGNFIQSGEMASNGNRHYLLQDKTEIVFSPENRLLAVNTLQFSEERARDGSPVPIAMNWTTFRDGKASTETTMWK